MPKVPVMTELIIPEIFIEVPTLDASGSLVK
jgi:hypothetical protein